MFTKSGSKLVRFSIPSKTDQSSSNVEKKQVNQVNGHINDILTDLESKGCIVTAIPQTKERKNSKNVASSSGSGIFTKSGSSIQTLIAKKHISSKDVLTPQRKSEFFNDPKRKETTIPNAHSKLDESTDEVFPAFQAKGATRCYSRLKNRQCQKPPPDHLPEEQSLTDKCEKSSSSCINFSKYINGTKYVCYTPKSDAIKRERHIQANENEIKQTVETATQCDLIEDESSSESSQSDWINEIIEEYEYLEEDGDMFECNVCGEVCRSHLSNLKHSMTHKESSLLCFRCGRLFPNTSKLLEHEEKMHTEDSLTIKKALRCPKLNCVKAFHSERQLFDHIDQHTTGVTEQRCRKCQRSFPSSLQLLSHVNKRNCWR